MIEIHTFEGTAAEFSEFVTTTWRRTYEGKMPVPLWGRDFLERELLLDGEERPYVVAAYDGTKMVACHPGRPIRIRLHGEQLNASLGSFLSVDPDYRRQGIAARMHQEFERRHHERGDVVNFGFLYYRTARSMGKKFWLKQPKGVVPTRKVGHWVRPLGHRAVADSQLWKFERWGTRALSLSQRPIRPPGDMSGIRAYRNEDLPACLALVEEVGRSADLAYLWDEASLGRQLQYKDLTRTVVLQREGRVAGLINYYLIDILEKHPLPTAVIDLVAFGTLPSAERRRLLRAAMSQMVDEGLEATIVLRGSWYGWRTLAWAGFFPIPSEYYYAGTKMRDDVPLENIRRMHVLWR